MFVAIRKLKYRFKPPARTKRRHCHGKRTRPCASSCRWKAVIALIAASVVLCVGVQRAETRMTPVINEIAISKINGIVTLEANEAVQKLAGESGINYNDLLKMNSSDSGTVTSLTTDFTKINDLKSKLAIEIQNRINQTDRVDISIPIGAFFSDSLMGGFGIGIPVKMMSTQSLQVDFHDEFEEAGINQTRHRLMIVVKAPVSVISAVSKSEAQITTEVPLAETIIVGNVPNTYLNFGE